MAFSNYSFQFPFLQKKPWVPVTRAWRVPWVAEGGVGLQIWRLAANKFIKHSWTADQEWSSNNLTLKKSSFRNVTQGPGTGLIIILLLITNNY